MTSLKSSLWTGGQPIKGSTQRHSQPHTHLKHQLTCKACILLGGGRWSTLKEPT